jgi:LysM repeat protein
VRHTFPTALILLAALFVATVVVACGGGSDDDNGSVTSDVVPTATLPASLPDPIIVSGTLIPPSNSDRYTVQEGDSPSSIAARFGVSLEDLLSVNDISDPTSLFVGQELVIPSGGETPEPQDEPTEAPEEAPTDEPPAEEPTEEPAANTYTVQAGDTPQTIAAQFGITPQDLMDANGITDPASLQIGQVLTIP